MRCWKRRERENGKKKDEGEKLDHQDTKRMEQQRGKILNKFDNVGKTKRNESKSVTNYSVLK